MWLLKRRAEVWRRSWKRCLKPCHREEFGFYHVRYLLSTCCISVIKLLFCSSRETKLVVLCCTRWPTELKKGRSLQGNYVPTSKSDSAECFSQRKSRRSLVIKCCAWQQPAKLCLCPGWRKLMCGVVALVSPAQQGGQMGI